MRIRRKKTGGLRWTMRFIFLWMVILLVAPFIIFTDSCSVFTKNTWDSYILSAVKYTSKKDYKKAIKNYTRAIELNPNLYKIYFDRANVEMLVGDSISREMAIDDFEMYINANEGSPQNKEILSQAYLNRGKMMIKLGYKADACSDWESAKNLNQSNYNSASEQYRLHCK